MFDYGSRVRKRTIQEGSDISGGPTTPKTGL